MISIDNREEIYPTPEKALDMVGIRHVRNIRKQTIYNQNWAKLIEFLYPSSKPASSLNVRTISKIEMFWVFKMKCILHLNEIYVIFNTIN